MKIDTGKFRVSTRSLMVIIPAVTLLAASLTWNVRQYVLIEQLRLRELAAKREETARAAAEARQAEARLKKNAEWAASDARVQQLYREIDGLSQISERVFAEPTRRRRNSGDAVGHVETDARP
jgi:hypothetical protein